MNTKILEYIVAVAEKKSITKAAELFYLSQPVLSRHIKKAEQELGVSLFVRSQEGIQLTESGMIFINNAQAILQREKELNHQLTLLRMEKKRKIRLVIDKPFHNFFIQRILPVFHAQYADFHLDVIDAVNSLQVIKTLEEREAEIGISTNFPSVLPISHNLNSLLLSSHGLMMVMPGSYQGKMTFSALMDEIRGGRIPVLQDIGTSFRMAEEHHLARAGVYPQAIMESGTFYNGLNVVAQNPQGCAYAPLEFQERCQADGLRCSDPFLSFEAVLLTAKNIPRLVPLQALTDLLLQEFRVFMDYCTKPYQEGSDYSPPGC